jgi:hypothetical protein
VGPGLAPCDRPALGQRGRDRRRHVGGFALAERVGARRVVVRLDAEQHRPRLVRRVATIGDERDVLRLRLGLGDDQVAEHVIHELDHLPRRAEVPGEVTGRGAER